MHTLIETASLFFAALATGGLMVNWIGLARDAARPLGLGLRVPLGHQWDVRSLHADHGRRRPGREPPDRRRSAIGSSRSPRSSRCWARAATPPSWCSASLGTFRSTGRSQHGRWSIRLWIGRAGGSAGSAPTSCARSSRSLRWSAASSRPCRIHRSAALSLESLREVSLLAASCTSLFIFMPASCTTYQR